MRLRRNFFIRRYLAESFRIPVVVTNQVITRNRSETVLPRECFRPIKKSREEGIFSFFLLKMKNKKK